MLLQKLFFLLFPILPRKKEELENPDPSLEVKTRQMCFFLLHFPT